MRISKQNSGRVIASLIFLTPIIVLISSSALFYSGYTPDGTVNKGTLLSEPIQLSELNLEVNSGPLQEEFPGKWSIVQFNSSLFNFKIVKTYVRRFDVLSFLFLCLLYLRSPLGR